MPVLGQKDVIEPRRDPMNDRDDGIPIGNRESAARAEVILHVDNHQSITARDLHA
jgi:hypothetical protein